MIFLIVFLFVLLYTKVLNIYHLVFCIFYCDICEESSEIFKSFGLLGLEITCIAKIDTNLKKTPIPIRMSILESKSDGVLGYVLALIPSASSPPWNPYLKGERYITG